MRLGCRKEGKFFFFEKKKQKTFDPWLIMRQTFSFFCQEMLWELILVGARRGFARAGMVIITMCLVAGCTKQRSIARNGACTRDPVNGCATLPSTPEPAVCPVPVPTQDAFGRALSGVSLARKLPGGFPAPLFPVAYTGKHMSGTVKFQCVITEAGELCGCKMLPGDAPEYFGLSASQWLRSGIHYAPALKNGIAVASERKFSFTFEEAGGSQNR